MNIVAWMEAEILKVGRLIRETDTGNFPLHTSELSGDTRMKDRIFTYNLSERECLISIQKEGKLHKQNTRNIARY
jgi:hypothetical protein